MSVSFVRVSCACKACIPDMVRENVSERGGSKEPAAETAADTSALIVLRIGPMRASTSVCNGSGGGEVVVTTLAAELTGRSVPASDTTTSSSGINMFLEYEAVMNQSRNHRMPGSTLSQSRITEWLNLTL